MEGKTDEFRFMDIECFEKYIKSLSYDSLHREKLSASMIDDQEKRVKRLWLLTLELTKRNPEYG